MERYEKQSYQPERLEISCNGSMGLNGEPFSLTNGDMMKQNILIAAYEKPVTVKGRISAPSGRRKVDSVWEQISP